jgi:outer membrane immunogenic protein
MRTKLWSGISVLASIVASVGVAGAADLSPKPVYTKAPPPPVILSDWAGFYLGVHGGGGWDSASANGLSAKTSGGLAGGHAGYNWQFGSVVLGLEGDFDGGSITGTDSTGAVNVKTDELASIRGRLGYTFAPNVLAYGTAGAGWGHTALSDLAGDNDKLWQTGWVAGGGLEYKFYGNWSVRAEYLHYGFDSGSTTNFDSIKNDIDVVRGGVSYKF